MWYFAPQADSITRIDFLPSIIMTTMRSIFHIYAAVCTLVLWACLSIAAHAAAEPVKIGVLAFRPKPQTLTQWQPLAEALKQAMPEYDFVVNALTYPELERAVASRQLDFVLTNPGHYVMLAKRSGLSSPLATLATSEHGFRLNVFGGVMFTRAGQARLTSLKDLKNKTFAATSIDSLGGFQMQAYELSRAGVPVPRGDKLISTGMPHDNVIESVLAGHADVGFVRTGVLEALASEGKLDMKRITILNDQHLPDFPLHVSTRLYPEWPFVALPLTDENLARRVAAALFLLEENKSATRSMGIHGFVVPADYTPVADLLRELRLPPFEAVPEFTLQDVWSRYHWPVIAALAAIGLILLLSLRLLLTGRKLESQHRVMLQQQQQLQDSQSYLQTLIDTLPDLIWLKDKDGVYLSCNPRFERFFGASEQDIIGKTDYDFVDKALADSFRENDRIAMASDFPVVNEEWVPFADDGHIELLETTKSSMRDAQGNFIGVLGIGHDITRRKQAEDKLQLAASVFTHAREGIMITEPDGTIIDVNDTFTRITGFSRDEVVGKNPRLLKSGMQSDDYYAAMWQSLTETGQWYSEIWNRRKDGELFAEMQAISAVRDAQGQIRHYVSLFSDITALKQHESRLERIAHYDALTGLPNRVLLADRLHQAMSQAQRRGQRLAVAYLDLDGFKAINDNYGHEVGDQLLMTIAPRMKDALREGDTLARLGGDEFVAVMLDLEETTASVPMLDRLLSAAAQPVKIGELELHVSASLGVAFYPQAEEVDADQLLRQSDQAMYEAKVSGKNRYYIFDEAQLSSLRGHHETVDRIRAALAGQEFVLYYQPKVSMRTGTVIGAEALIRWQHPERGLLPPALFLPLIEDHPLAIEIGEWVIESALVQMERWHAAGLDIPVSVNIGARQLQQAEFVERLQQRLAVHAEVIPCCLELEVLETSALQDLAQITGVMEACRKIGVRFALDDFGTGYSSLTYLKHLPVTLLKIDQSFVRGMLDNPDDLAILQGVVGLAGAFRRELIAEGVETVFHGEMLLQLGCEFAQGYGIARPMPAEDMPDWVGNWKPSSSWVTLPAVSREDFPLLFASVEYRAWASAMEHHLKGERAAPPEIDQNQSNLLAWLNAEGLARHGGQPAFQAIVALHQQMHALAAELLQLHESGRGQEARARLNELDHMLDVFLAQIKMLLEDIGQPAVTV